MQWDKSRLLVYINISYAILLCRGSVWENVFVFSFRVAKEVRTEASTIMNYTRCFIARRIPAVLQDVGKMSCRVLCPVLVSLRNQLSDWSEFREETVG